MGQIWDLKDWTFQQPAFNLCNLVAQELALKGRLAQQKLNRRAFVDF
jgi:hypothetical protein